MSTYTPVEGAAISKKAAQIIGDTLSCMEKSGIDLTPRNVVAEAKKKSSPLHKFFDWDDRSAASKYRILRARYIINSYRLVLTTTESPVRPTYSVTLKTESGEINGRVYRTREVVVGNNEMLDQVLRDIYVQIRARVADAESVGARKYDPWWERLCSAFHNGKPRSSA